MVYLILFVLGLAFGSFINALVWRLRQQQTKTRKLKAESSNFSILKGRSVCTNCGHRLAWHDLIPIASWLGLKGKCRYCGENISWQYPAVELMTAILFTVSYHFWPYGYQLTGIVLLSLWLIMLTGLVALAAYDLKWMLLPNRIIAPLVIIALGFMVVKAVDGQSWQPVTNAAAGLAIGGGLFYLLFQLSGGRWIGGGDVKLGFLLGLAAGGPVEALLVIFLASLIGSITSLGFLISKRLLPSHQVPFGPFLITAEIAVVLFGGRLIDWYQTAFLFL